MTGLRGRTWAWWLGLLVLTAPASVSAQILPAPSTGSATATEDVTLPAGGTNLAEVLALLYGFNGATWTRVQTDAAGALRVRPIGGLLVTGPAGVVKPPLSPPTGADPALVVAISPVNNVKVDVAQVDAGDNLRVVAAATDVDPYTDRVAVRITEGTTTNILAGIQAKRIRVFGGSVCVDAAGIRTNVTLEDTSASPIDLFSGTTTKTPYSLAPGQCLDLTPPSLGTFVGQALTAGQGLRIVTTQAGPVNVVTYVRQE